MCKQNILVSQRWCSRRDLNLKMHDLKRPLEVDPSPTISKLQTYKHTLAVPVFYSSSIQLLHVNQSLHQQHMGGASHNLDWSNDLAFHGSTITLWEGHEEHVPWEQHPTISQQRQCLKQPSQLLKQYLLPPDP